MRLILLFALCLTLSSCPFHWRKHSPAQTKIESHHFIDTLKTYEPLIYKGKVPDDFYTYYGFRDWWRFPLVYPYTITCIDVLDYGTIVSDKDKTDITAGGGSQSLSTYFDEFIFDKNVFVGAKSKSPFDADTVNYTEQYFIFKFADGKSTDIAGSNNLKSKLKAIHFAGDTSFTSIRKYGDRF
ncbi:MAG: hypothetical protein JWO06_1095 [Bacteroidota bacterium]|nr:hypothetical protein [Bacteroidota bacterium]